MWSRYSALKASEKFISSSAWPDCIITRNEKVAPRMSSRLSAELDTEIPFVMAQFEDNSQPAAFVKSRRNVAPTAVSYTSPFLSEHSHKVSKWSVKEGWTYN